MEKKITPKNAIFDCSFCNFKCSKNSDWIRHITTDKHNRRKDGNKMETFEPKKTQITPVNVVKYILLILDYGNTQKHVILKMKNMLIQRKKNLLQRQMKFMNLKRL